MPSFNDIIGGGSVIKKWLKTDWSKEEAAFRDGMAAFRAEIDNPFVGEIPDVPEDAPAAPKKDEKKTEEKPPDTEVRAPGAVESSDVGRVLENTVPAGATTEPTEVTEPQKEQTLNTDEDDPFAEFLESAPVPQIPKAEEKKPQKETKPVPPPGPAQPAAAPAKPVPPPEPEVPEYEQQDRPAPVSVSVSEGFDHKKFAEIRAVMDRIMAGVKKADLNLYKEQLPKLTVHLALDQYRENADLISDYMVKVQAKRDTAYGDLMMLEEICTSMKEAEEYALGVGSECSSLSSEKKRVGEVKLMMQDFFVEKVSTERLRDAYDMTYKHLHGQLDTLSRLLTAHQLRMKLMGPGRYEEPAQLQAVMPTTTSKPMAPPPAPETTPAKVAEEVPWIETPSPKPTSKTKRDAPLEDFKPVPAPAKAPETSGVMEEWI